MYQRSAAAAGADSDDPLDRYISMGGNYHPRSDRADHPFGIPEDDPRKDKFLPHIDKSPTHRGQYQSRSRSMPRVRRSGSLSPDSARNSRSASDVSATSIASSSGGNISFPKLTPSAYLTPQQTPSPLSHDRVPEMVEAFDKIIAYPLGEYLKLSVQIGQDVHRQGDLVEDLFRMQREFLLSSCKSRVPSAVGAGPRQARAIQDIREFTARHDHSPNQRHLRFISDTIPALGWVVAGNHPSVFIRDCYNNGKQHVSYILNAVRSKNAAHADWVRAWQEVILDLDSFVREFHKHGLIWHKN